MNDKKKKVSIPACVRRDVWIKEFGIETKLCPCCKTQTITPFDFDCAHVVSEAKGGATEISNLKPICRSCNLSMSTMNLETFQKRYYPETPTTDEEIPSTPPPPYDTFEVHLKKYKFEGFGPFSRKS